MLKYKSEFFFEIKNVMLKITISAHGARVYKDRQIIFTNYI